MDPSIKSPEEQDRLDKLRNDFNSTYKVKLEQDLGEDGKELIGKITGQYELQDGDINKAVERGVSFLNIEQTEKQKLTNYLLQILTTQEAISKLNGEGLEVKSGDILSKINAETLPGNHINFNGEADNIKHGENISTVGRKVYQESNGERTQVGEVLIGFGTQSIQFPIIERLFDSGEISEKVFRIITDNLEQGKKLENSIGKIENSELKERIVSLAEKVENNPEENKVNFLEDFSEKAKIAEEEIDFENDNVMSIIGENYIKNTRQ